MHSTDSTEQHPRKPSNPLQPTTERQRARSQRESQLLTGTETVTDLPVVDVVLQVAVADAEFQGLEHRLVVHHVQRVEHVEAGLCNTSATSVRSARGP